MFGTFAKFKRLRFTRSDWKTLKELTQTKKKLDEHSIRIRFHSSASHHKHSLCYEVSVPTGFLRQYKEMFRLCSYSAIGGSLPSRCFQKNTFMNGISVRWIKTSANCSQENNNNKKGNDDDESKTSLLAKSALWMMTAYIVITLMSLLFPSSNQPDVLRFVSWNEFIHHMVARGEVEEVVVSPEMDLVTVFLYDNAVIKGKKAEYKTYHLKIADINKFEEKLREVEKTFGIAPGQGVPVIYERNQESAWLLLVSVVAVALMILMVFRNVQIKTPPTMDFFLCVLTFIKKRCFTQTVFKIMKMPRGFWQNVNFAEIGTCISTFRKRMVTILGHESSRKPSVQWLKGMKLAVFENGQQVLDGTQLIMSYKKKSQLGRAKFTIVDPLSNSGKGVRFKDVAGLKEAKVEIMEFVDYLKNPGKYKILGAKVPKGVLLLGPPGCGKTMLAKAVSTEAKVPFLAMAGSEFIEMIGGLGAARVRDLFKEGRKRAPCIIYIDEIDAIGRKRSASVGNGVTGEGEQTLNQLLVELDGMATKEGVIMLASTNRADVLDKALLRPGRFDRHILIDLPTLQERKEIFEQHLKSITLGKNPEYYSQRLGQLTPGFSGADIANVCNEAALRAARDKKKEVDASDLEYAVERVVGGTEKRSAVISPQEKKVIAYHECGHALMGWLLKHTDALMKVSILPRTTNVLGFAQYLPSDQKLYSTEELLERMCMALGGRVAESLVFNHVSTGAQNDLQKVTKMAYAQIKQYGMDSVVGPLSFPSEEETGDAFVGKKPYSKALAQIIDEQARSLVAKAYKKTETVLLENMDKLKLMAEELLKREVLNYDDVEKLIGPPKYGKKQLIEVIDFGPIEETPKQPQSKSSQQESRGNGNSS